LNLKPLKRRKQNEAPSRACVWHRIIRRLRVLRRRYFLIFIFCDGATTGITPKGDDYRRRTFAATTRRCCDHTFRTVVTDPKRENPAQKVARKVAPLSDARELETVMNVVDAFLTKR
jgi:hypothetical protein